MRKPEGPVNDLLNVSLDMVDVTNDRDHQGFLVILQKADPLPGMEVLIE